MVNVLKNAGEGLSKAGRVVKGIPKQVAQTVASYSTPIRVAALIALVGGNAGCMTEFPPREGACDTVGQGTATGCDDENDVCRINLQALDDPSDLACYDRTEYCEYTFKNNINDIACPQSDALPNEEDAARDGEAPAPDAGRDTGVILDSSLRADVAVADAALPNPDATRPTPDSAIPPRDAMPIPGDGNQLPADAAQLPEDSAQPPVDAVQPVADAATPDAAIDGSSPVCLDVGDEEPCTITLNIEGPVHVSVRDYTNDIIYERDLNPGALVENITHNTCIWVQAQVGQSVGYVATCDTFTDNSPVFDRLNQDLSQNVAACEASDPVMHPAQESSVAICRPTLP